MESAVLEIAWTAERKETMIVCKEGTKDELVLKREGGSGGLQVVSSCKCNGERVRCVVLTVGGPSAGPRRPNTVLCKNQGCVMRGARSTHTVLTMTSRMRYRSASASQSSGERHALRTTSTAARTYTSSILPST